MFYGQSAFISSLGIMPNAACGADHSIVIPCVIEWEAWSVSPYIGREARPNDQRGCLYIVLRGCQC
ncbi:hypothetical protein K461DRAFT_279859 [Myriangium duriaei CBS 260.36]|uniref:Uncharacterized protein n=1 Tax=Myriangium duriaei CBS 260.36 TaxID=1168546 RepID=A0A9P4IW87_9PEZI|nr:hypothetical protein K461DRAFT_279859 [Myriangium duriaei CBS 260.36]